MPRKKQKDEVEFDEDILDEDEEVFEEVDGEPTRVPTKKPIEEPQQMVQRFATFEIPRKVGIMDTETKEVIGEGEHTILQALAMVLTKLENIENQIGSID